MMEATMQVLTGIATFVLQASLKAVVLIALVLLVRKLFDPFLSANGRYLLWLPVVVSLATPVGFDIVLPILPASATFDSVRPLDAEAGATPIPESSPGIANYHTEPTLIETSVFSWQTTLSLAWLTGVVAVLLMMGIATRRFTVLVASGQPAPQTLQHIFQTCVRQAGCKAPIRLLQVTGPRAPVLTGLFRPTLLWPAGLEHNLTPPQLRHVFTHELMHVQRRDALGACVVALLQALHWFNPAVWIAFSSLRHDREMACDAATLRRLEPGEAHEYAHTLIQLGAQLPQTATPLPGLGILDEPAQMHRRIHMLLRQSTLPALQVSMTALLFLTLGTLAFGRPAANDGRVPTVSAPVPVAQIETPAPTVLLPKSPIVAVSEPVPVQDLTPVLLPGEADAGRAAVTSTPVAEVQSTAEPVAAPVQDIALAETAVPVVPAPPTVQENAPEKVALLAEQTLPNPVPTDEAENIICRRFTVDAELWHICDRAETWDVIAGQLDMELGLFPTSPRAHESATALALTQQVCVYRDRPGSFIKKRICDSAAQWIANRQVANWPSNQTPTRFIEGVPTHAQWTPPVRP